MINFKRSHNAIICIWFYNSNRMHDTVTWYDIDVIWSNRTNVYILYVTVLQYMGHNPTLKEVDEIIASVDADNTGEIEFDEFVHLMQKMKNARPIGRT